MKIKFISDFRDGDLLYFSAGEIVELPSTLANQLLRQGTVELIEEIVPEQIAVKKPAKAPPVPVEAPKSKRSKKP